VERHFRIPQSSATRVTEFAMARRRMPRNLQDEVGGFDHGRMIAISSGHSPNSWAMCEVATDQRATITVPAKMSAAIPSINANFATN
jgi:hypothetical protein